MRLTILAHNAHRNCAEGVARIHYNIYSALKRLGIETKIVSIIDTKFENTFEFNSPQESRCERYLLMNVGENDNKNHVLVAIKESLADDPDLIINGLSGIKPVVWLRILKNINHRRPRLIESLFSRPFKPLDKGRYISPSTEKILVYSPSEYRYLSKIFPSLSRKIVLVPPPIDTEHFVRREKKRSLGMLGLDDLADKILIGYVGNPFLDRFPLLETFKALANLISKHDVAFLGVFPPYEGRAFSKKFYKVAKMFGLERRTFFIEKFIDYDHRPSLYSVFDVLLHLYKWREAPYPFLTALEALSAGIPVITTNYIEIRWALGRNDYPLFIDLEKGITAASIKNAFETYISQKDTEYMKSLISSVHNRINKMFSLEFVGKRVLRELGDLY